jgi:threonine aldolase
MIDLRSDTVTRPDEGMRKAMYSAEVGDDVFSEDPTINQLEESLADLMGKEEALFCASGTMANQIAIKVHTSPGDQVICSWAAHIYNYEGGGMASNSGVTAKLLEGDYGLFTAEDVVSAIHSDDVHFPISRLVSIEDTSNKGGGATWPIEDIKAISEVCASENLGLHLDGARLFNRLVARGDDWKYYTSHFDSLSICLSKGLGAPVGSLLLGNRDFIHRARRARKSFGGGMRQAGILAAAGLYAIENNIDRLSEDHRHAKAIAIALHDHKCVSQVYPVETNIIIFTLKNEIVADAYIKALQTEGVLAFATGPNTIRFVLHLDVVAEDIERIISICSKVDSQVTV